MDQQINLDALHEECGVFGIYGQEDAAAHCALGLHALQHRGQEAAGMVTCHNGEFFTHHDVGYVGDIFNKVSVIDKLKGSNAIGHVRYSTAGKKSAANFQPIFAELELGDISLAHNGNLTNANDLRQKLIKKGAIFKSSMDTEVILHLIAQSKAKTIADRIIDALNQIKGAYSILIMTNNSIYAIRDPHGVRPLSLGKLNDSYVIASESCAFDINGAKLIRDIQAGEMVVIDNNGLNSYKMDMYNEETKRLFIDGLTASCIFQYRSGRYITSCFICHYFAC